ncbi:hypothetical protein L1049_001799 [Liquidambar formosana]|uniref:RING-type E3 ubiquitin transferase n=1 Tax=Liquidambar formosana TaxID=63359 RepID=A0AAP0R388_LIQFO
MDVSPLLHHLLGLVFLMFFFITVTTPFSDSDTSGEPSRICKFERFSEVMKECSALLSSASKLKLDNKRIYGIASNIYFQNGDWVQEAGGAPLMPFDDSDLPVNFSDPHSLLKLVSFGVMGVDFDHQLENAVGVCGLMSIGITRNRTLSDVPERWYPWFHSRPGNSELTIPFEGLYAESEENGGERLMCLLGTSLFPFSEGFSDPLELSMGYGCAHDHQFPLLKNDRILLVLRYPQKFTLISRAVHGEMRSLNDYSDPMYFDKVYISSLLSYESNYQFVSEKLVSKACEPYPYNDDLIDDGIQTSKKIQFCIVFQMFSGEMFDIVANLKCDGTEKSCNNLGPFVLGSKTKVTSTMLDNFRLLMTDLHCVPGEDYDKLRTAKVSAVFRAVSPLENQFTATGRTGVWGTTISAEGIWNSSSGQLCMVGCVVLANSRSDGCNSRICLYLPSSFSITQRSIIIGTISSLKKTDSYTPFLFKKVLRPLDLWNRYSEYSNSYLSYKYSKSDLARALLKRNENLKLGTLIKKLFLKYPTVEDSNNITGLSLLSDELSFGVYALPEPLPNGHLPKIFVTMEVLSLGPLFGRYRPHLKDNWQKGETERHDNFNSTKQKPLLNVSAQLSMSGNSYSHIPMLFLEGLYDPRGGRMYLIGCRDVPGFQKFKSVNFESRMDCLIEVKVEYSSKTTRWLINPTAKISISSRRNEEDPLHFRPISFRTSLITYIDNSKEIRFRRNFEDIFRILVLSASISCILSQLLYVKKKADVIPFMSLVMLGSQALVYGIPLITNTVILFKWKEFQNHQYLPHGFGKIMWFRVLDCTMKFLLLVTFVLTLRLCQKVWKSRSRLIANKPKYLKQNPSDKRVFLATWTTHMVGFLLVHIIHNLNTEDSEHLRTNDKLPKWVTNLEEYMGLVQDFFLLPQIIGNVIWQIQVKPLRKFYYIGFTILRLLARAYDYIRDPVFNPYFHDREINTSSEFFSKSEDVVIMTTLAVLAIIVHAQQRRNINKLNQIPKSKQCKPPPHGSNLFEDFLSK